jgi:SAM-dependent methyltransferase
MTAVLENRIADEEALNSPVSKPQRPPMRLRSYHFSKQIFDGILFRAHRLAEALHTGFWLGLLDDDQINAVVVHHYDEAELYRTAAHNLHGFLPYEKELIRDHFNGCRSVVVAAAGGGREMIALAQAGIQVDGFECNPSLVEKCRDFLAEAGVSARILYSAPDQVPSGLQEYDGGIVGWGAFAHIVGRTKRINFLKDLKRHLQPGAPLFLSVGRRPEGSRYHAWIYRIAWTIRTLRRAADAIELGDDLLNCFSHRFVESELRSELQEAGFEVLTFVETHEIYAVAQA